MCLVTFSKESEYTALAKVASTQRPSFACVAVCDDCTHRCPWCYVGSNRGLTGRMSFEDYSTVLRKVREMGVLQLSLTGGEPTEHPDFRRMVERARQEGFLLHVMSHGERIDREMTEFLKAQKVSQVQINWQGRRFHDAMHGRDGSGAKAETALRLLVAAGLETTATVTVGDYNSPYLEEILGEAAALGVGRLRVWDATGYGSPYSRGIDVPAMFERCRKAAASLGYRHCLSFDPDFPGDAGVPCMQLSDLFMYIDPRGKLAVCNTAPDIAVVADFLDPAAGAEDIRRAYLAGNRELLGARRPYCIGRERASKGAPAAS